MNSELDDIQEYSQFVRHTKPFIKAAVRVLVRAIKNHRPNRSLSVIGFNLMYCSMQMRKGLSDESTNQVIKATRQLISTAENQSLFCFCLNELSQCGITHLEINSRQQNNALNDKPEFVLDHEVLVSAFGSLIDFQDTPLSPKMFNEAGNLTIFLFGLCLVTYQWQVLKNQTIKQIHKQIIDVWLDQFDTDSL